MRTNKVTQEEFLRVFEFHYLFYDDFYCRNLCTTFQTLGLGLEFEGYWKKINILKKATVTQYFNHVPSQEEKHLLRCLVAIEFLRSIDMLEE